MTNSFVLTPTKLLSVVPNGTTVTGLVAFRDYKGDVHHLDFEAYGETAKKLQEMKIGSRFDAEGNLDIYKERAYLTVFNISSISGVKKPEGEDSVAEVVTSEPTPVAAIAPKASKTLKTASVPQEDSSADYDSIPF